MLSMASLGMTTKSSKSEVPSTTRRAEDELMEGVLKERVLGTAVRGISRSVEFANRSGHEQEVSPIPNPTPKQGGMI